MMWNVTPAPPHQLGQMTYSCAIHPLHAAWLCPAAVSHGLTSSPQWGEATRRERRLTTPTATYWTGARLRPFSPWGEGAPKGRMRGPSRALLSIYPRGPDGPGRR